MDVVIVGAGIGGLALANGLAADGHAVRVLEGHRAPRRRRAVTIFSKGMAAAAGLGIALDGLRRPHRYARLRAGGRADLLLRRRL